MQSALLTGRERGQRFGKSAHASRATGGEQVFALGCRAQSHDATIPRIGLASHEPFLLECAHESCHGRRFHLLGRREIAERDRTAKDDNRKRGQARASESGLRVLATEPPEQVYRQAVPAIGKIIAL